MQRAKREGSMELEQRVARTAGAFSQSANRPRTLLFAPGPLRVLEWSAE